jgi:hypothetical protein
MESKKSAEQIFLQLMRDQTGDSSLSLEAAGKMPLAGRLLERIKRVADVEQTASPPDPPAAASSSPAPAPKRAVSAAMLQATIRHSFVLSELNPTPTERDELLAASDLQMINGNRRLRLKDDARAAALETLTGTDVYNSTLRAAVADDVAQRSEIVNDPIQLPATWIRHFLSGSASSLDTAPPTELKAAL